MFACIFFNEDASLSVVGKNNKSLKLVSDDWGPRGKVEMYWPGKVAGQRSLYHGTIIKVGDEENLNKFATLAYSKILKKQKGLNDVPEELFSFEMSSEESSEKRHRSKTKKMQESEEQEDTLSPKKKKKKDDGKKEGLKENKDEEKEKKKENSSTKQPEKQKKVSKKLEALPEGLRTLQNKYCSDLFGQFSTSVPATLPETDGIFSVSNFNLIDPESTLSEPALPVLKPNASKTPVDPKSTPSEPALPVLKPTASKTSVEKRSVPLSTSASSLTMTDTWEVCMNAVNATATSDHESMQSLTRPNISAFSQVPIPSGEVLQVLEGLMKPEVQLYIRDLVHFVKQNKPQNSFENTSGDQQSWEQTGHHHDFTAPYRQIESHYSTQQNMQDTLSHTISYNNEILNSPHTISSHTSQYYDNDTYTDYTIAQSPQPPQTSFQASTTSPSPVTPRRSPRKHTQCNQDFRKVKLLDGCDVEVDPDGLRKATSAARKSTKPGFTLCYKLLSEIFPLEVLANSRGQGIGRVKQGDVRLPLDKEKTKALKNYVTSWCKTNGYDKPAEQQLNDAITERISYARKQLRPKQNNK